MRAILLYLRMALRRRVSVLLVVVFAAAVTGFLLSYPRLIDRTKVQLEHAYDAITVTGEVLHKDGHSIPPIRQRVWHALRDSGYLLVYQARADYAAMIPKIHQIAMLIPGYEMNDPDLAQALSDLFTKRKQENKIRQDDPHGKVKGLSDLKAYSPLLQVQIDIKWAEGYDESCFLGDEMVALVPESYGYSLGDTISLAFGVYSGYVPMQVKVVGLVSLAAESSLFMPLKALEQFYEPVSENVEFLLSSLRFSLADSRKTEAFREWIKSVPMGPYVSFKLDDEILHGTIDPIQSNLQMLEGLYPVFFAAVAAIGFVLCFLLVRRRKQEFAVMRLLGETGMQITGKALLEQAMLCVIGVVLGAAAVLVSGLGKFSALTCGGVLLCYSIGSALAVMLMVRVNVMEILRDKE